jgi:CheY-like chemotaxis protein
VSLSGSVEDLPLLEILQVVAFAQRTGYLAVKAPEGEAGVVFREGRVVAGYIWDVPPLGPDAQALPGDVRQDAIRGRITAVLQRLSRLREGEFIFNVAAEAPNHVGTRDLGEETLEDGINPEGMMLDLARQLDEDRRETSAALEASLAAPAPEPDEEPLLEELVLEDASGGPRVLLVDDESDVRRLVGAQLADAGFDVVEASDARSGRREAARLVETGDPFVIVTDLGLPSLGGSNFRGGLEVADFAAGFETRPRILLMAESADERLRNKARRLGVSILALKPGLSKLDPLQYDADLRAFGRKLACDLVPRLLRPSVAATSEEPAPAPPPVALADEVARESALRSALDELARHPEPDLIAFLLLRAARAFLPRAVLFLVKDDSLRGLAGFGPTVSGASLDLLARELSVSLDEPSPFATAVAPGHPWNGPPPVNGPTQSLLERIGPLSVADAAVIPVRAQRETIAVLYGDAPDGQPLPALDPLAHFADQAGRALDEAFLARRGAAAPA